MLNLEEKIIIKQGFLKSAEIAKNYAKTFYFASRFLPTHKRYAAFSVYAVCRLSDETVDNAAGANSDEKLFKIRQDIELAYKKCQLNNGVLLAFRETVNKYGIPKIYFDEFLEGMQMDLEKRRYENFEELYRYCYRVAGIVGLMMLKIFGYKTPQEEKYAVDLGVAMQLTNILRDIGEDYERQRIYIPQDELARFGVPERIIHERIINRNFKDLLRFQINRTRQYYRNSQNGIKMVDDFNSRFVILAMKEIYSGILDAIERNKYDVFSKRAHVNTMEKILFVLKILIMGRYL